MLLGVNIDHIATLRNARGAHYPSPVEAALTAQTAGADYITIHLREDRRHINEDDVADIHRSIHCRLNLEMGLNDEILDYALRFQPSDVCLVPEKRQELTTEGGLDIQKYYHRVEHFIRQLTKAGIHVSLFIDPLEEQIEAAAALHASAIELHTGTYANAKKQSAVSKELSVLETAAYFASDLGLLVNAGHGLNYHNVLPIARLAPISELNIGHAIIAQALFTGLANAVKEMKNLIFQARILA